MKFIATTLLLLVASLNAIAKDVSCSYYEKLGKQNKQTGITPNRNVDFYLKTGNDGSIQGFNIISSAANGEEMGGGVCDLEFPNQDYRIVIRKINDSTSEYKIIDKTTNDSSIVLLTKSKDGYQIELSGDSLRYYCGAAAEFPNVIKLYNQSKKCKVVYPKL